MTHQIFTASYSKDAEWYRYSLMSMKKFCRGFLPPVVCVSKSDEAQFRAICAEVYPETTVAVIDGDGVARAQVAMMRVDEMCPNASWLWLMGSDCMVSREWRPEPFFHSSGKPVMLYNTFEHLLQYHPQVMPWKVGTQRVLGFADVPLETMRRVPTIATPELYRRVRAHVERHHGLPFDKVITDNQNTHRDTSETNILGAYAWEYMRDTFHWVNMNESYQETIRDWPNPVLQMWSVGGMEHPCDQRLDYPGGNTFGHTPRALINEVLSYPTPS